MLTVLVLAIMKSKNTFHPFKSTTAKNIYLKGEYAILILFVVVGGETFDELLSTLEIVELVP